jgi:transposase InsO family protein
MGIRDKPIAPGSPWQNGFAERLIGSIRRECVDHVFAFRDRNMLAGSIRKDSGAPDPQSMPTRRSSVLRSFALIHLLWSLALPLSG